MVTILYLHDNEILLANTIFLRKVPSRSWAFLCIWIKIATGSDILISVGCGQTTASKLLNISEFCFYFPFSKQIASYAMAYILKSLAAIFNE